MTQYRHQAIGIGFVETYCEHCNEKVGCSTQEGVQLGKKCDTSDRCEESLRRALARVTGTRDRVVKRLMGVKS